MNNLDKRVLSYLLEYLQDKVEDCYKIETRNDIDEFKRTMKYKEE